MEILHYGKDVAELVKGWKALDLAVALVPTMGALHDGHMRLVEKALEEADRVVVSIFLNPVQFNRGEDLDKYPRTPDEDLRKLEKAGVHCAFVPGIREIYPPGFSTKVTVSGLTEGLCGKYRPGHFDGVTTVCAILFGIVSPHVAVFGMKDAQQLAVVRRMVRDLRMGIGIVPCETVREPDGLAMSSRNAYLDREERAQAPVIYKALLAAREAVKAGVGDADAVKKLVEEKISTADLAGIQYVEVVDPDTMERLETIESTALLAVAVYFGDTRLIDNMILDASGD